MIGDQLRTRMILYGHPGCINTAKCLQTAAEKGVDIENKVIDIANEGTNSAEYRKVSPLGLCPALQDIDFIVYGTPAILSYLDDKGFGPSLVPRNGVVRAVMYQWAHVASELVQGKIANGDMANLGTILDALDEHLISPPKKGDYICGDFTLADIHWSACFNMLVVKGEGDMINSRTRLNTWFDKVKKHPSSSKENIVPYTMVPTADDIQSSSLRDISINV